MRFFLAFVKNLVRNYDAHNISRLAAEATYYEILAIVPFLIIIMNVIMFFAYSQLPTVLGLMNVLPPESKAVIEPIFLKFIDSRSETILSVGLLFAFWTTSKAVNAQVRALNIILNTTGQEESWYIVHLKSFVFTIGGIITGFIGLFLWGYGQAVAELIGQLVVISPELYKIWMRLTMWIPLAVMSLSLAVFYRYAPKYAGTNRLNWLKTILSGFIGTGLWFIVTLAYRYYIADIANSSLTYGPLVGLMVLFVWLNLSAQAVLMGAEVTVSLEETILEEARKRKDSL